MDIKIKAYLNTYAIDNFTSASGVLTTKEEFILSFKDCNDIDNYFAMELPLSPSYGETTEDIINHIQRDTYHHSKIFRNALSYFLNKDKFCGFTSKAKPITIYTYAINEWQQHKLIKNALIKLKAAPNVLDQVIDLINTSENKFIIDFNKSLTRKQLEYFLQKISLEKIYAIEQASPIFVKTIKAPFYNIADESYSYHGYDNIHIYNYNAFIFKPFANNFNALNKAINNKRNYWGAVGSNISGPLDCSFVNLINNYLPIKLTERTDSHFINHPLNRDICNLYIKNTNGLLMANKVAWYLNKYCGRILEKTLFNIKK